MGAGDEIETYTAAIYPHSKNATYMATHSWGEGRGGVGHQAGWNQYLVQHRMLKMWYVVVALCQASCVVPFGIGYGR